MKQQSYEYLMDKLLEAYFKQETMRVDNLMAKMSILRRGGDRSASVMKKLVNKEL